MLDTFTYAVALALGNSEGFAQKFFMSEMVKRVARAIEDAIACDDDSIEDIAKAAIEAMREPTEAMVSAGEGISLMAEPVWLAMIEAALKE